MDNVKPASRTICISDTVLSRVVELAAQEVEGVAGLSPTGEAVTVENLGGAASVNVQVIVKNGSRAIPVANQVQKAVKQGVQDMTGIIAVKVNVEVGGMASAE
ncbi:MAG: Asp23/Gls24 family envelope stress response protein [Oscillospiraceae bacterium]